MTGPAGPRRALQSLHQWLIRARAATPHTQRDPWGPVGLRAASLTPSCSGNTRAFDLARKVRRVVAQVKFDALPRLLTNAEQQKLGFR